MDIVKELYDESMRWEGSRPQGLLVKAGDTIHCLRAELEALKAAQAWQPIKTAPRDGTRVMVFRLLYLEDIAVCFYSKSRNEWVSVNGSVFCGGTHWMPLPPTDSASAESSEGASQ